MLDGYHRCHTISNIRSGKVHIFFFQDTNFSGIGIHDTGKCRLETGQMGTALCIVNIVTKAQHILMELIHILDGTFHGNAITFSLEIHRFLIYQFFVLIQILHKSQNAIRFMEFFMIRFCLSSVFKDDGQRRIQISCLMKATFDLICGKIRLFKNLRIRKEINAGSGLFRLPQCRKQSIHQLNGRNSPFKPVMMHISFPANLHIQVSRQCIHHRRTYPMQTAAGLVITVIKFSSRMECGKYQTLCRHSLFMHANRNTTAVIDNRSRTILFQIHLDPVTFPCQMFIHRIIHDLIHQMVQTFSGNTSDVHTRSLPNRFQSFQYGYTCCIIGFLLCHTATPFLNPILLCQKKLPLIS